MSWAFSRFRSLRRATLATLGTYDRLEKQRGHIYNWYDIETLKAIPPFTVSAVDSGNLLASLYTVHGGALDLLRRPLIERQIFTAIRRMSGRGSGVTSSAGGDDESVDELRSDVAWLGELGKSTGGRLATERSTEASEVHEWLEGETERRIQALTAYVREFTPWLLPEFGTVFDLPQFRHPADDVTPALEDSAAYVEDLSERLDHLLAGGPGRVA